MATTSTNKRQRTGQKDALLLSDLPDGILSHAASFLASPQKALFGLSMTAPSESWTNNNFSIVREHQQSTAAILKSEEWDILDLEDIEKSLAVKLTDDDLHAVLKCISAQDVLKKLNLTGCINITGRALEPLRGSAVIEHIDLSLVKQYELPKLDPEPMISETDIIPVLYSIVSKDGNSLKMVIFPKKWRVARTTELTQFLGNYNQLLESREPPKCSRCAKSYDADTREWDLAVRDEDDLFGIHSYCCYKCMNNFCYTNSYDCYEDEDGILNSCSICEKEYCEECNMIQFCGKCNKFICDGCTTMETCDGCEKMFCRACAPSCTDDICACVKNTYCKSCSPDTSLCTKKGCNKVHCADCELCDDPQGEVE